MVCRAGSRKQITASRGVYHNSRVHGDHNSPSLALILTVVTDLVKATSREVSAGSKVSEQLKLSSSSRLVSSIMPIDTTISCWLLLEGGKVITLDTAV